MAVALPLLLLLLLLPGSSPNVLAAADDEHGYTLVAISSLKAKAVCSGHRVPLPQNRTWVPLSLSHGSCSPWSSASAKPPPLAELLQQDQRRVEDIQMRLSGVTDDEKTRKHAAKSLTTQMNSGPVLNVNVGTSSTSEQTIRPEATSGSSGGSGVPQTVMLDSASDVPWVQCGPCWNPPCPSYDPARSSTYAAFPCNSSACARLGSSHANGCINNQCQYRTASPDGLTSSGTYGSDVLTIGPANTMANFKFGCSHAERGSMGSQAAAAGIMALSRGVQSLVSQTASTYGSAFSYCIPPTSSYPGFFTLGSPIAEYSRFVLTPMMLSENDTFHRVLLRAITVAGQQLDVAPELFAAGAVLDSRTAITRLPLSAYDALRAAFRSSMVAAGYREAPPKGSLDACFDIAGVAVVRLPRVALVFDQGAVVELDPSGILFDDCLAFASNADDTSPGILGSVQQQTIEVLYDVGGGAVGFRRLAC